MGVDKEDKLRGKKLHQKDRDDIRLEIDEILTNDEILRRTKDAKISCTHVTIVFEDINNTYGTHLEPGKSLQLVRVKVDKRGWTGGLVQFNETKHRAEVPRGDYTWCFYGRDGKGKRRMTVNEVRQSVARDG